MKRIVITGGAGFIGSNLTKELLTLGYKVYCLDHLGGKITDPRKRLNVGRFLANPNFTLDVRSLLDANSNFQSVINFRPDAIIHLAGKGGVRDSMLNPDEYYLHNVDATNEVIRIAKATRVTKLVFSSSSSVYGEPTVSAQSEDFSTTDPLSVYAQTKLICEKHLHEFARDYDCSVSILRFFSVYGANQRPDMAITRFVDMILDRQVIPVFGDGNSYRDYTHVSDIVRGVILTLDNTMSGSKIYNVGSGRPIMLRELIHGIEEHVGVKARLEFLPENSYESSITHADLSKSKHDLGYMPRVPFEEGLQKYIESRIQLYNSLIAA